MTMSDIEHNHEAQTAAQESLGAWLRNARAKFGLDLTQAARRVRTRTAVIEALENDRYQALGAPVFIRMYLLRYAESLGLPEHETLRRFKALGIDQPPPLRVTHPLQARTKASDLRWLSYPAAFALIGWLGWTVTQQLPELNDSGNTLPPGFELTGISPDQLNAEPTAIPPALIELPDTESPVLSTSEPDNDQELIALAMSESVSPPLQPADPPAVPITPPPMTGGNTLNALGSALAAEIDENEPEPPPNEHELVLEFSDACWVEVEDGDGRRLVYELLGPQDRRTLQGPAPFSIRLGNAAAARISLNGEPVERSVYLPDRGSVSRFTLEAPPRG